MLLLSYLHFFSNSGIGGNISPINKLVGILCTIDKIITLIFGELSDEYMVFYVYRSYVQTSARTRVILVVQNL